MTLPQHKMMHAEIFSIKLVLKTGKCVCLQVVENKIYVSDLGPL